MQLIFLGTASCYPTAERAVSCTALRLESGEVWMFDCGEGSQIQLQKSSVRPGRITKIFITHLHGDHLFGLPGLMCTLGNQVTERPNFILEIYGPQGIRRYVRESLNLSRSQLPYDYMVHELVPNAYQFPDEWENWQVDHIATDSKHPQEQLGRDITAGEGQVWHLFANNCWSVSAGPVEHRVPTFGFVVTESDSPGRLDVKRLTELGVPPGPLYNRIKHGETITLESGKVIIPSDVLGPAKVGRKLTLLGDTCNASAISDLARDSDVLIHEATLENSMVEKAKLNGHSTPAMAAALACDINARLLVLYHFSQRYSNQKSIEDKDSISQLLKEAQEGLGDSSCQLVAAEDLMELTIPRSTR